MMNRTVGSVLTLVTLLFSAGVAGGQTYTQMQWGMNKATTPYQFGANINGIWSNLGTVSSSGVWGIPAANISGLGTAAYQNIGTSGVNVPLLSGANTWSGAQTFSSQITTFSAATADLEIGSISGSNTPLIDFRSSGLNNDFDARILASGGTATPGQGSLTITASGGTTFPGKITFNAPLGSTSIGTGLTLNTALQDLSSVVRSPAKFFFPDYFGNPATGIVHRANRLFLGEASAIGASLSAGSVLPASWMDPYFSGGGKNAVHYATLSVGDPVGINAITGYSRTSDFKAWSGSSSGGSQAINAFAVNDDTSALPASPIAVPIFTGAVRVAGVNGITLNQFDVTNEGNAVDTDPYDGLSIPGTTWGLGITAGFIGAGANPVTGFLYLGNQTAVPSYEKAEFGILSNANAFNPAKGNGGNGVFAKLARGQSIQWYNSLHGVDAELYAIGDGLHAHNTNLTVSYNIFAKAGIVSQGVKPTITGAGGTCAAGTVTGGAIAGTVALTGNCVSGNTLALTGMPASTTGYACDATDRTAKAVTLVETTTTTTSVTFEFIANSNSANVIQFKCIGY